jgi:uncharacterized protein YbbC (DUF1343 family)
MTGTEVVVLDRPNPLTGMHVQGPVSMASTSILSITRRNRFDMA